MAKQTKRQLDYRRLSTCVQRVVLKLEPGDGRGSKGASAKEAARYARDLESSAGAQAETHALRELGARLNALEDAQGESAQDSSYAAVLSAANGLEDVCSDFVNPPLNAIWADAVRVDRNVCKASLDHVRA